MNLRILIGTVILELLIIGGVSWVLQLKAKHAGSESFITSNRNMPMVAVAATQALTCLGGGHILGMTSASWSFGQAALWFAVANGIMLIILFCFTGPWIRRFGYTTINEVFEKMFGQKTAIMLAGISAGTIWGVMTLEIQGVGAIVVSITNWPMAWGCIIGGIIGLLYVIFGGMKEVGWVNVVNATIMYLGVFIALIWLGYALPNGWTGVNQVYIDEGKEWMLSFWSNSDTWRVYIFGTVLSCLFYVPIGPQAAQVSASAKSVNSLRKAVALAVPMNVIFGVMMVAFGMAARSLPEYNSLAAPPFIATFLMLIDLLPWWLVAWLFASFAAAMLSTVAVQILVISTIFVQDVYIRYYKKDVTEKKKMKYLRLTILIVTALGTAVSTTLPAIENVIVWLFAWLLPAFWVFTFGMLWKRSSFAAFYTIIICGIFNIVWSFSPLPTMLHLDGNNNSIGLAVVSFVLCILFTVLDKNAKPSFVSVYKKDKFKVISPDLAKHYKSKQPESKV